MSVADTVTELLSPIIGTLGVELIDVEWIGSSLRVVVDEGDGITTDRLTEVNRLISPILDQHDPVPGRYTLEVSSPGVERKLTRALHYTRAVGEDVVVKLEAGNEPRRIKGRLRGFDEAADTLTVEAVELDGVDLPVPEVHEIPLREVAKTRTVFQWGPTPKQGGKPGSKKAAAKKAAEKKVAAKQSAETTKARSGGGGADGDTDTTSVKARAKNVRAKQHPELDDPPISESNQSSKRSEAPRHEQ